MKKSLIWTVAIVIIIALGGGFWISKNSSQESEASSYTEAMNSGKSLVQAKKYAKASRAFEKAYQIKSTKAARAYSEQADELADAISDAKNYRFTLAISSAKSAANKDNGYQVMTNYAKSLTDTLTEVKDNVDNEIKPLFVKGKDNEDDEQYDDALKNYQEIIDLPYINGKYYAKYLKQAQDDANRVKKLTSNNADQNNRKKDDQSSSSSSAENSQSSESSSSQSSTDKEINSHHSGDHTVNGQTVQDDTLTEIKKQLDSLGYNSSAWSPQDMIDLYRSVNQTSRTNPSQITKDDVENYLKKQI